MAHLVSHRTAHRETIDYLLPECELGATHINHVVYKIFAEYLAPEIVLGSGHNRAVDYFALGVLIYEMICGQTPFYDFNTDGILRNIVRGKLRFGPKFTNPIKDIITVR